LLAAVITISQVDLPCRDYGCLHMLSGDGAVDESVYAAAAVGEWSCDHLE
jgi:hypothetical protein